MTTENGTRARPTDPAYQALPPRGRRPLFLYRFSALTLVCLTAFAGIICAENSPSDEELQEEWTRMLGHAGNEVCTNWWKSLQPEQLRRFLRAGVDVTRPNKRNWTPLHSAARDNTQVEILSILIEAGANVQQRDSAGDTPLHWAAARNPNPEIVSALLEAGAKVNERDCYGWTALHTAAEKNSNPEVMCRLLDAGAQPKLRAYFLLFTPSFLLKHNPHMPAAAKEAMHQALRKKAEASSKQGSG